MLLVRQSEKTKRIGTTIDVVDADGVGLLQMKW